MSIYELKPKFQNLLRPLVKRLFAAGITANQVTIFACGLSVCLGIVLSIFSDVSALFWLLPLWMLLRMALNAVDGMLAREFNQQSKLGGYLNEVTDVLADSLLYLPFAFISTSYFYVVLAVIYLSALTEFIGVLGQVHGNARRYDGPMGKSDRAFIFGFLGLVYALWGNLGDWGVYALWIVTILLLVTCVKRIVNGLKAN